MVSQGLWGAIEQYWTVEEKPRLYRRNTYFEDHHIDWNNARQFTVGIVFSAMVITIVMLWSVAL